jgi:hypothetical protein
MVTNLISTSKSKTVIKNESIQFSSQEKPKGGGGRKNCRALITHEQKEFNVPL